MGRRRKNFQPDDLKEQAKVLEVKEEASQIIAEDTEPEQIEPLEKRGRPKGAKSRTVTKEGIRNILKMPFTLGYASTGFSGFQMSPLIEDEIVEAGYQVYLDFGFDVYSKWLNLITFILLYGGSLLVAVKGYKEYAKTKQGNNSKPELVNSETKTGDNNNSGKARVGQDDINQGNNTTERNP